MRTPAVHVGSQLLDFLKNGAQLRLFLKQRGSHATVPLNNDPIRQGFYQGILKKKFGLLTYTASDQKRENAEASRPRPVGLSLEANPWLLTMVLPLRRYGGRPSELFHNT
jgi:hypothetical protein